MGCSKVSTAQIQNSDKQENYQQSPPNLPSQTKEKVQPQTYTQPIQYQNPKQNETSKEKIQTQNSPGKASSKPVEQQQPSEVQSSKPVQKQQPPKAQQSKPVEKEQQPQIQKSKTVEKKKSSKVQPSKPVEKEQAPKVQPSQKVILKEELFKSFAETIIETTIKNQKQLVEKQIFIYEEKDKKFKDDFIKEGKKKEEIIIKQQVQEEPQNEEEMATQPGAIKLTADTINSSQSAHFLIISRQKTKIECKKYSLTLQANSEQILIVVIKKLLEQFPQLSYEDLVITQCGKEVPFGKSGGYLCNVNYTTFEIIMNMTKLSHEECQLEQLKDQGFEAIELYQPKKNLNDFTFSKLFVAQMNYLKQFNEIKTKLKASTLKQLLEDEQFATLVKLENTYQQIQKQFETKCLEGITQILNGKLKVSIDLDEIYSNEFEQYIFDNDIAILMFKTFYDSDIKELKKACSIAKLISLLPQNQQFSSPKITIFKNFENIYFVCYTLLPITKHDYIYGSDEQSILINSNIDQNLSANEMKSITDYFSFLGQLFNFQEMTLYEKCSEHKRICKLPLGTCLYKNQFSDSLDLPKYSLLNFKNFIFPINNAKQMEEFYLLMENNFQLVDGIYIENLKKILPSSKNVQKKQINLIMDEYHHHKEEKQLLKQYCDNDLLSLSSSIITENPSNSVITLQIDINEEGLKQLFNNKKFKLDIQSSFTIVMHLYGIGIKNLGSVFKFAPAEIKSIVLVEVLGRIFKNQVINNQILDSAVSIESNDIISKFEVTLTEIVGKFINKQFNEDQNKALLNEIENKFNFKLSFDELCEYKLNATSIVSRTIQLIMTKLEYYSKNFILLRSSAINKLTKSIISLYLAKQSKDIQAEISENKELLQKYE